MTDQPKPTATIGFVASAALPASLAILNRPRTSIVPCDRDGCVFPAKHQIVFGFWSIGQKKTKRPATKVLSNLCVCEVHKLDLQPQDFMADNDIKAMLLGALSLRGFPMPDFKSAVLEFEPIVKGRKVDPGLGAEWMRRREA